MSFVHQRQRQSPRIAAVSGPEQQVLVLYVTVAVLVVVSGLVVGVVLADRFVLSRLLLALVLVLAIAFSGAWWLSHRLQQPLGLDGTELGRAYAHHYAVLHAIREGLVVIGPDRRVLLVNDAARELLGAGPDLEERPVEDLPVSGDLARILESGETIEDEVQLAGERLVVVSQAPLGGPSNGTVLTVRDHSQVMALADELSAARSLADGLRAQVHESANRLHTLVSLVELGDTDAAVELATSEVRAKKALTSQLVGRFDEQTLVAVLLGKVAEAERRAVELVVTEDSQLIGGFPEPIDLVTIVGNFLDNAIDAALTAHDVDAARSRSEPAPDAPGSRAAPRVWIRIREEDDHLLVQVRDSGPGFSPEGFERVFEPGWSTKPAKADRRHGRGIGMALVQQVVSRRGGSVEVANAPDGDRSDLRGAVVTARLPLPEA